MAILAKSTAYSRMFKMISSTDHLSLKTGASPVVNISKAGGAFGAAGGAVTEVANGWYKVALNTTDTGTVGDLAYYITGTGADDTDFVDQVADPTVALFGVNTVQLNAQTVTAAAGVTFPTSVASPTNITAGTITTTTNLTNLPSIPANWITSAGINPGALNGKGDWLLSSSYTAPTNLTAAQIATGVWTDTTPGDFTTGLSIGKTIVNGVSLGTGLTVNAVTGLTASNLDTTISSRMASYTQPAGFLAATFPTGTIANTTNITAGTITTVGTLTTYTNNTPQTGDAYLRLGAPALGSISADIAAAPTTLLDQAAGVETNITLRQGLRLMLAAMAGKASGMATTSAIIRDTNDTKNRITATVDVNGNRTAVSYDVT